MKLSKQSRRVIAIGYMDIRDASLSAEQAILSVFHPRERYDRDARPATAVQRRKEKNAAASATRERERRNESGGRRARKRRPAFYWTFRCVARSRYQRVNVATIIELNATVPGPVPTFLARMCLADGEICDARRDDSPRETETGPLPANPASLAVTKRSRGYRPMREGIPCTSVHGVRVQWGEGKKAVKS